MALALDLRLMAGAPCTVLRPWGLGQRALHSALTFVYALGKPPSIPAESFSPCKVVSRSCKPAHIVTITEAIEVISDSCKPIDIAVITEAITVISKSCKPAGIVAET